MYPGQIKNYLNGEDETRWTAITISVIIMVSTTLHFLFDDSRFKYLMNQTEQKVVQLLDITKVSTNNPHISKELIGTTQWVALIA